MRNRNNHSLTIKKKLNKCSRVFHGYNDLQMRYGESLDANKDVVEIKFNVLLKNFELGDSYTTDFVCTKLDGNLMVRECVYKKNLLKPTTIKLLDASRNYWLSKGITDWGIVLDEQQVI